MNGSNQANPFVGPRPLERGQSIFGRDAEIDQLYYRLSAERILLFHSPSGAGKSSLLQAGLLPRLAQQFDVWTPARVNLPPPAAASGLNRYVRSCALSFETELPASVQRPDANLSAMSLSEYVASRPRRRSAPANIVLLFDQFEEILTVDPAAFDARGEFFAQLGAMLQNPRIWALFALREDYLAQLDPYAAALPTHLRNRFRLDLLQRDAAEETIRRSVEAFGRSFAPEALRQLVADLALMQVQQPSGEFKSEPGPYVEPLHLQVTCRELWERMPASRAVVEKDDVASFGNVTSALAAYYRSSVAKAAASDDRVERAIRGWFGEELIARGSIRVQILREPRQSGSLANDLIERLIDAHLVRAETRAGATWYELAHDRLIEPVLRDNEHWFATRLSNVERRALQWEREREPESLLLTGTELKSALRWAAQSSAPLTSGESRFLAASRRRRMRLLQRRAAVATLVAFLAITSVLGLEAFRQASRAKQNLALATQAVDETLSSAGRQKAQEFADSPDLDAFRDELLNKAATFYASFTQQESGNAKLRTDAAWGHAHLGDVKRLLGRFPQAVTEYQTAISTFESLAAKYPGDSQYPEALGYCHNWLGETWRAQIADPSAPDAALAHRALEQYNAALAYQQKLHGTFPGNRTFTQELARTDYNRGIVEDGEGDRRESEADFRLSLSLLLPMGSQPHAPGADQDSPDPAEDLARVENNLASLLAKDGNEKDAQPLYEQAIAAMRALTAASPENRGYLAELATYDENEASLLRDNNDLTTAADRNHDALDLVETLANPAPALSLDEIEILQLRSEILLAKGSKQALDESERERQLLTRLESGGLAQSHPLFHELYENLAANYVELAQKDLTSGDLKGAQISMRSLSLILTELTPDDKAVAQQHYDELQRELRGTMIHRR
ncbi:MAG TPA: hypothetical protein VHZ09_05545 [Acidobacteriaceae bacterium]|jgi:CRP-like cAMP-binding protein|nr:hypothetical protein [Acidobacteriaceae bacterium]